MSQHTPAVATENSFVIGNQAGASFRSDLNEALMALATNNSLATAPGVTADTDAYAYMWWVDTDAPATLYMRNGANDGWVTVGNATYPFLGLAPSHLFRLNADLPLIGSTSAQSIFGVGCSLLASTVYEFEMVAMLKCDPNATNVSVSIGFACSNAPNNFHYQYIVTWDEDPGSTIGATPDAMGFLSTTAATQLTVSNVPYDYFNIQAKGTISVNSATTFTPQVTFSSPTPVFTTNAGSYIKLRPIGAAGANTNVGGWS
jgi:hypothetical protein